MVRRLSGRRIPRCDNGHSDDESVMCERLPGRCGLLGDLAFNLEPPGGGSKGRLQGPGSQSCVRADFDDHALETAAGKLSHATLIDTARGVDSDGGRYRSDPNRRVNRAEIDRTLLLFFRTFLFDLSTAVLARVLAWILARVLIRLLTRVRVNRAENDR